MICVDDSDYMRNGDFVPTRLAAMQDAVNIVSMQKVRSNPENNVGLLTLASSEVLTTLTTDQSKLMSKMLAVQPGGELKLMSGLRVAHLALKHRQGKNHKMRIVVFVGSPLDEVDETELVRLAKRLKKEKVNVDIIAFGDELVKDQKILNNFIDALNGRDGTASHLIVVPPGPTLTDALLNSPILQSEDGAPIGGMGGGGFDFGIDPNDDPELALALRVSMEEQRARQEAEARAQQVESTSEGPSNEEQMLETALRMSIMNHEQGATASGGAAAVEARGAPDFSSMSEEEQIAYAMQMSIQDSGMPSDAKPADTQPADTASVKTEPVESMEVDTEGEAAPADMEGKDHLKDILEGLPDFDIKKESEAPDSSKAPGAPAASSAKKSPEKETKRKPDPKASSGGPSKKK
jgi:26S proteasome regulatory subunit N10